MPSNDAKSIDWEPYLDVYREVIARLQRQSWYADGWEARIGYLGGNAETGVWMRMIRPKWFGGAVHLETWVNRARVKEGNCPVVVHIETTVSDHGVSKNEVSRRLLERVSHTVAGWSGYRLKPNYATEPIGVSIPCGLDTLGPALEKELSRQQTLGTAIDEAIEQSRR